MRGLCTGPVSKIRHEHVSKTGNKKTDFLELDGSTIGLSLAA